MIGVLSGVAKWISALLSIVLFLFVGLPDIITQNKSANAENITQQIERIDALSKNYASGNYEKVDESALAGFDVQKAYADGVKFNEVAYIATHNSYQLESVSAYQKIYRDIETVSFGLFNGDAPLYCSDTLTEQFNIGVRSIELDIETVVDGDSVSFVCSHSPLLDMTSSCYDFSLALEEIKMWSDANPDHLPITIIIEPKEIFIPDDGMKFLNIEYLNKFDELLRDVLGDKLITPAEMMGEHVSLKEMREADDWMTLEDAAGRVAVLLHDTIVTDKYIEQDETIKTQAMFPMLRYKDRDKSYASFLIANEPEEVAEYSHELVYEKNIIVRTMVDTFGSYNEEDRRGSLESGVQILSTDYPPKTDMTGVDYYVDFEPGMARVIK
ncbi:MAG: hypothetical protein IJ447_09330 [Clostridia bacterium]|nr:hypothetical protein [Clostridia bacterium]